MKLMKRSFFISLLLHGAVLFLFFSWGIPLGERSFARNAIQVMLVAEEGGEGGLKKEKKDDLKKKGMPKKEPSSSHQSGKNRSTEGKIRPIVKNSPKKPKGLPAAILAREDRKDPERKPEENKNRVSEKEERTLVPERRNEPPVDFNLSSQRKEPAGEGSLPLPKTSSAEGPLRPAPTLLASGSPFLEEEGVSLGRGEFSSPDGPSRRMSRTESPSSEENSLLARIVGKIEAAKRYPRIARRMGIQGTATVRFKLKPNGHLEKIELVESSGSKILDDASLETVREAAPLPYKEGWLKVGIVFKIL
jgi:protein TonB